MATAVRESGHAPTLTSRAVRACQAALVSRDARILVSAARDAVEDGVHDAKRAIKSAGRRLEELGDLKAEAARSVKRHPASAVGAAFGAGLAVGLAAAWVARRRTANTQNSSALLEAVR